MSSVTTFISACPERLAEGVHGRIEEDDEDGREDQGRSAGRASPSGMMFPIETPSVSR
jgi:hypothetical protein